MEMFEKDFVAVDAGVAVVHIAATFTQSFDFGAGQNNPSLKLFQQGEVEAGFFVAADDFLRHVFDLKKTGCDPTAGDEGADRTAEIGEGDD